MIIIFFCIILRDFSSAQTLTDSNLPIIIISEIAGGGIIPDDPRVQAKMKIIYRGKGERNYLTDQNNPAYLNYDGLIDIEIRGRSTQEYNGKKQYGFSTKNEDLTNNNVSILGLPPENDWVLNGMTFDRAFMRDYLAFNLSRNIGEYAPGSVYCELVIGGSYMGLYLLTEKIKVDDNRVDITKIDANDVNLPDLSGGYIIKADLDLPFDWQMQSSLYHHYFPKPEDITAEQHTYIYSRFKDLETYAIAGNASVTGGFPSVIDIPSFINFIIIQELSLNKDGYDNSTFFHKDRNGKLRAGPVWDFDQAFGSGVYYDIDGWHIGDDQLQTNGWRLYNGSRASIFWSALFDNPEFRCQLSKRWNELTEPDQPLDRTIIETFIDKTVSVINEAAIREYTIMDYDDNFQTRIDNIKNFLNARITWITNYLGSSSPSCNIEVPHLVITKIMYHPETSVDFPDSEDLEFIEITNNSDRTVDLTGIYFGGTGLVYQFPAYSSIEPYKSIFLASNAWYFELKYGFVPFGQFTRHLSNKSEDLTLLDAFGNLIDHVKYSDSVPWPDADGNGYYLMLPDANLDNSIAENWTASKDKIMIAKADIIYEGYEIQLFPNPVNNILRINAPYLMKTVMLYNIFGQLLKTADINSEVFELDMNQYTGGLYILTVSTPVKNVTMKIIKN